MWHSRDVWGHEEEGKRKERGREEEGKWRGKEEVGKRNGRGREEEGKRKWRGHEEDMKRTWRGHEEDILCGVAWMHVPVIVDGWSMWLRPLQKWWVDLAAGVFVELIVWLWW